MLGRGSRLKTVTLYIFFLVISNIFDNVRRSDVFIVNFEFPLISVSIVDFEQGSIYWILSTLNLIWLLIYSNFLSWSQNVNLIFEELGIEVLLFELVVQVLI